MNTSRSTVGSRTLNACADFDLQSALAGQLSEEAANRLSGHLEACPSCRSRMDGLIDAAAAEEQACHDCADEPDPAADSIVGRLKLRPQAFEDFRHGDFIGPFRVVALLGKGGSSAVYECDDTRLARRVAVKVLTRQSSLNSLAARHQREARMLARLDHPGIVKAHEIRSGESTAYIVMELVAGGSSRRLIKSGPLKPLLAARLVEGAAEALHHAHEHGIVHRDVKPSNLLVVQPFDSSKPPPENVTLKISDFGLARPLDDDSSLTSTNAVIGTPAYMPPEQARGRLFEIGPASDIYSLGAVLYEYLVGRPPLVGECALTTLRMIDELDPLPPRRIQPGIPLDLETICLKCLRKKPEERYASARELAEDLRRFQQGRPILARPIGRVQRVFRWCRRNPLPAGLIGGICVLVSSLVALAVTFAVVQKDLRRQAEAAARRSTLAAEEARIEGDFSRNLFTAGFRSLDQYIAQVSQVKALEELPPIAQKARRGNEAILRIFLDHIRAAGKLQGESIDKLFRDANAFRELGYESNAEEIFRQLVELGKSLPPGDADYTRARHAAIRSASVLAVERIKTGQNAEAARILLDAEKGLAMDHSDQNDDRAGLLARRAFLEILMDALRSSGQGAKAESYAGFRNQLQQTIDAKFGKPK